MATVQTIIDSARYDLVDYVDGVGLGIEFDDTELLNYMNRMVGILDSNLVSLNSDLTEAIDETHETVAGQDYIDLTSSLNSGNWLDIRSVWLGANRLEKVSLGRLRHDSMYNTANRTPYIYALAGRKIYFIAPASGPTELMPNKVDRDFSAASAWTDVDIAVTGSYDESGDLSITAGAAGAADYCTLAVASAPMSEGQKYRVKYDLDTVVESWYLQDFTGAQTFGTIDTADDGTIQNTINFRVDDDLTGGFRLAAVANDASGNFDNFKLYNWSDCLTIFYDKKTAALALTSSMPYDDMFNEFLREMLVLCAKAKKEGIINRADGVFNNLFKMRVMQEEISRSFIPRNYNYMEF